MLRPTNNKRSNKKKKKGTSTFGGQPEQPKVVDMTQPEPEAQPTDQTDTSLVQTPPPSSCNASPKTGKKRQRNDLSAPDANLKRQKEIIEENLAEKVKLPSISDLQACMRVGENGLGLFNELVVLMTGELSKRLEGKISELIVQNRHLEGVFLQLSKESYAYRDENIVSFSEDNRDLKAELERLRKMREDLDSTNNAVATQGKQLKRLPVAEKELQDSRKRVDEAEAREQTLKARVDELSKVADKHLEKLAQVSIGGFKRAIKIFVVLEPGIEFKSFDSQYEARDGKVYEGKKVVYDPEVDGASEEDEDQTQAPTEAANNT